MTNDTTLLQRVASELADSFERKARGNGDCFTSLKDHAPDWCRDAVQEAHGSLMPNDWSYEASHNIALGLVDLIDGDTEASDVSDIGYELVDAQVDIYNAARTAWLASHLDRIGFCDEACDDGLVESGAGILDRIAAGQYIEARQIYNALAQAIIDRVEELESAST